MQLNIGLLLDYVAYGLSMQNKVKVEKYISDRIDAYEKIVFF